MKMREGVLLAVYGAALRMYPVEFRAKYREPMLDAARRAQAESKDDLGLLAGLLWDTFRSALREHLLRRILKSSIFATLSAIALMALIPCIELAATLSRMFKVLRSKSEQPSGITTISIGHTDFIVAHIHWMMIFLIFVPLFCGAFWFFWRRT